MTIWRPTIAQREGPLYLAIANSIADDVRSGKLAGGERLPPQRDLAEELEVALTTVTRAYMEAERRGLVSGEVGRGTFVRRKEMFPLRKVAHGPSVADLTVNSLLPYPFGSELTSSMAQVLKSSPLSSILDYQLHHGSERHREAGAKLLRKLGLPASSENVLVTNGAQHAMAVVFSAITQPGDTVLTAELTYSGMKSLANFLHIGLRGLAMDDEGIRPDAFEAACLTTEAKALYCMPTLQNPTAAVMSEGRRRDIAAIAERYRIAVVEDDSYGFLLPEIKPLGCYAADASKFYYITGTSKSLAPGLRIGFLEAPLEMVDRLAAAISSTTLLAAPALAEVVSRWIEDGTMERVMQWKREEVRERQQIARRVFTGVDYRAHPSSPHGWLTIPEPRCVGDFVEQARMRSVLLCAAEDFAVGRTTSAHAVRVCVGPLEDRSRLEDALRTLAEILIKPPAPCQAVV